MAWATAMGIFAMSWVTYAVTQLASPGAKSAVLGMFMIMVTVSVLALPIVGLGGKPMLSVLLFPAVLRFICMALVQLGIEGAAAPGSILVNRCS
jgi:uncharacterized protein